MSRNPLHASLFVACRDMGLDQDARRDLQARLTGVSSLSDMTDLQIRLVIDHLKSQGWSPARKKGRHKTAPRGDLRFVHVLWGKLKSAGVLERPDRAGLNAFVRSRFGDHWAMVPADIDMLRDPEQISAVIEALKSMCRQHGITL